MPIPSKVAAFKRQSAKMKIYLTLRDWIINGTMQPGERLNDAELADCFSVSRTPIREAIQMLETQKLVTVIPNKLTVVSEIEIGQLEKLYQPLAHLQALGAQICCQQMTSGQLQELIQIDRSIRSSIDTGDVNATLQRDVDFHSKILKIADNEYIEQFSDTLMMHIQRLEYCYFKKGDIPLNSFASHQGILRAFQMRDPDAAFQATLENWLSTMYRYEAKMESDGTTSCTQDKIF